MQILPTALAIGVAFFQLPLPGARVTRSQSVVVRAVFDGDTIDVAGVGRVRLLGIDAPEIGRGFDTSAPFGLEARERLRSLVLHRWVRLEQEGDRLDAYNRHLAYVVREDGVFINAAMVREGLARVSARVPLTRLDELKRAEAEAQSFRRGMWGASPQIPSSSYTSRRRAPKHAKDKKSKHQDSNRSPSELNNACSRRARLRATDPRAQQALLPI
jgi:endonuclease YncB( thermonuclease family)